VTERTKRNCSAEDQGTALDLDLRSESLTILDRREESLNHLRVDWAALHDSLGQSLLIIKNRVALARTDINEQETVAEQLDELSQSALAAIEECREIAYNLRPYQINRFGLVNTLQAIFRRINEVTDIRAEA
jgi:signal transduction histidine kinase